MYHRERAEMHRSSQIGLKSLVERSVADDPVPTLLGKIKGGIDHWLIFVGEPEISPTNNTVENSLRELVILRKIIGTLRNDRGMSVHMFSWVREQPGRNLDGLMEEIGHLFLHSEGSERCI